MSNRELLDDEMVVFTEEHYDKAIIGVTQDGCAVYDYDKLVEAMVTQEDLTPDEAADWIGYNMIRSLPYIDASVRPVIVTLFEEEIK